MDYTKAPQKRNEPTKRETTQPSPYIVTKASKKSITFTACTFELAVAQEHRAKIKEFFIRWVEGTKSSKTTPFFSFQIVHRKHKGAAIQTFFRDFLDGGPFHPAKVSFMDLGRTQLTPKMVKIRAQRLKTFGQCNNKWSNRSSSLPHRGHLLARCLPLFLSCSIVKILLHQTS